MSAKSSSLLFRYYYGTKGLSTEGRAFLLYLALILGQPFLIFLFCSKYETSQKILIPLSILVVVILSSVGIYYKFIYQTPEQKALNVVTQMFENLKKNIDVMDLFTEEFTHTINASEEAYAMSKDSLYVESSQIKEHNAVVIGRKGLLTTGQESVQYFLVKKIGDTYKIDDSINYVMYPNTGYQLAETFKIGQIIKLQK